MSLADRLQTRISTIEPEEEPKPSALTNRLNQRIAVREVKSKIQDGKTPSRMDMETLGVSMNRKRRKEFAETVRKQNDNLRPDGTKKGKGFLGELNLPGGGVATEYSVGVQLESRGGKETDIPSLVPTLTPEERALMINEIIPGQKKVPKDILQKAVDHANMRVKAGKSIFAEEPKRNIYAAGGMGGFDPGITRETAPEATKKSLQGRVTEAERAVTRGTARTLSGFQEARARLLQLGGDHPITEPHFGMQTPKQRAALDKRAEKLHKDSELLWNVAKQPELIARNKDLADKAINLIGETIPYITATTAAYITAGPMGGFAIGNMVEGNSAYRTAQDHFKTVNKGKPLTQSQEKQAKNIGIGVGLVSGAVESFGGAGAEKLFRLATDKLKSKLAKAGAVFATGMVIEALEEGAQELAAITGEKTYRDVGWGEVVDRTTSAMAGGAFLGGAFRVAASGGRGLLRDQGTKELNKAAKELGVPIKGLTPEAAVRKIDQVMENRRALENIEETTDADALNALLESPFLKLMPKPAPTEAAVALETPADPSKGVEAPIGKEERETLREMGMSVEEIGKTPIKDLRDRINKRARRHAGGFLNIPVDTPEPSVLREKAEAMYQNYVNRFASIENITKKARKLGMVVPPGEDPGVRAREYLGMGRKVESVLRDKTFRVTKSGNIIITGEGLKPILDSYEKNIKALEPKRKVREKDFEDYLIAQRTIEDLQRPAYEGAERLIVSPEEVAKAKKKVRQIIEKYGVKGAAEIERHAQRLYSFQKRVLHSLVDSNNISQQLYDKIVKENPHYIPFDRVLDQDTFAGTPVSKKRFTEARAPVKKIKGGKGLAIQPPLETVIKNTYKILEAAERNHVSWSVAKLMNVVPGINPIRVKMFPIRVDPKEILTIAKEFRSKSAKVVEEVRKIRTEGGENADVSGPVAKLEKVVKDALTHRGFSEGESNAFIAQIKKGKPAEGDGPTHTTETIKQIIKETQQIIVSKEPVESTIFRPSQFKPKGNVIEYYDNGKRKYMEVPENLYKAMTGLTEDGASAVVKLLSVPAHWLRVGATITPEFMVRNPLRDTYTALMQTSFGFVPFYDQIGAIADILGKTDVYYDWFRSGGAYSGFVELSRPALKKAYKELESSRGRKLLSKLNVIADAEDASQLLEQATRLAVYKRAIRKGLTPVEAGYASREATVDFARRGAKMGDVNKLVAFFNASIQGFDKTIRNSIKHPYSTAIKGAMVITLPSLLLYLRNRDDPEYAEIPQWQKDLFWIIRVGDTHLRIPKPFLYGQVFGSLPERFFEYLDTKDPKAFDGLVTSMIESASPVGLNPIESVIPTAVKPVIENMTNYNFFRERSVVPEHLEHLPAAEQYSRYTTETAKQLGEWINYSPAKIENLIYGYTGGTGRHILQGTDFLVNSIKGEEVLRRPRELADIPLIKGFVTRPAIGPSAESISNFYENSKPIIAQRSNFNRKAKQGKREEAKKLLEDNPEIRIAPTLTKFQTALSELSKLVDSIAELDIDTEVKRQRIKVIDQRRVDLARKANALIEKQ